MWASTLFCGVWLLVVAMVGCGSEERAWERAKQQGSVADLEEFIARYPDSAMRGEAQQAIDALKRDAIEAPLRAAGYTTLVVSDQDLPWRCAVGLVETRTLTTAADVVLRWADLRTLLNWDGGEMARCEGYDGLAGIVRLPDGIGYFGEVCVGNVRFEGDYVRQSEGILLKSGGSVIYPTRPTS